MTASSHEKVIKQLKKKQAKINKYLKHNVPKKRKCGKNIKKCRRCGRRGGHISSYELNLCRQCFREIATNIGFKKYN